MSPTESSQQEDLTAAKGSAPEATCSARQVSAQPPTADTAMQIADKAARVPSSATGRPIWLRCRVRQGRLRISESSTQG